MVNIADSNKIVLAYNPSTKNRNPLWLSYSTDGHHWDELDVLADDAKLVYGESCMIMCSGVLRIIFV
jgi:hypothetical protein